MTDKTHIGTGTGGNGHEDGKVYLVGAGPGDPDLLTVKARRLLENCDVVLHDSLVSDDITEIADQAEVLDVGKRPDQGRRWRQDEINDRIVAEAKAGNTVVRLKGGDPCVFGRGGEEAEVLAENDVTFETVPGVTSAVAAPELAGIPLTHRDHSSTLTVITGHEDPTKEDTAVDWGALADTVVAGGTLVILMGVGNLPLNVEALIEEGVDSDTPVAIVERAALGDGSVTVGKLTNIVERARDADVTSPATVVVGDVVSVLDEIEDSVETPILEDNSDLSTSTQAALAVSFVKGSASATVRNLAGIAVPTDGDTLSFEGVPGRSNDIDWSGQDDRN